MTDRLCLRCDWEGPTGAGARCPRCGAPLYGWPPRSEHDIVRESRPPSARAPLLHDPNVGTGHGPGDRLVGSADPGAAPSDDGQARAGAFRRSVALAAAVVVAAAVIVAIVRQPLTVPARRPSLGLHGTLVFAVEEPGALSRLYRWDLASGRLELGPDVSSLVSLVDASGAHPGWIGVTTRLPGGGFRASVLRSFGAEVSPTPLVGGDLLAWGAGGSSVAVERRGPAVHGCRHEESIAALEVSSATIETQYHAPTCARVVSIGRAVGETYLTLRQSGRTWIDFVGYRVLHEILSDESLVSVSATNDMVVLPARDRGGQPTGSISSSAGAAVFFRGLGDLDPIPFADGVVPLQVSSFLAWTRDASIALVDGRLGLRQGVFELPVGPGTSPRLPVYVSRTPGPAWGTYADDGTGFVSTGGQIYALRGHTMDPLEMPAGAAIPRGPVVWLP